ncbi:polysaccharide deacetylase [Priestia aryabhattai]|uniref:polysaccharide deacetylase family protein n=1 Tax=Priestia flexa TaxID=86664 RepID=UPI000BA0F85A|nr:polysaccharide deacetylase family protein [Priestia flexa]OZT11296.1 polysaccharide deacetylase [Priestia aryabhattai]
MKKYLFLMSIFAVIIGFLSFKALKWEAEATSSTTLENKLEANGCLGLNYHRVRKHNWFNRVAKSMTKSDELTKYSVFSTEFEAQLERLKQLDATFVSPADIEEYQQKGTFPKRCVWLSFDDIDRTVYENAFPILKKENIPFTLYIIAGQVGAKDFQNLNMASWNQLKEMTDSGLATIGSHTYDMHRLEGDKPLFLTPSKYSAFGEDLRKSKETIKQHLGIDPVYFAYPYGNTNDDVAKVVKDAGFKHAAILAPHVITKENDPYYLNRIVVYNKTFQDLIVPWLLRQES